MKSIAGLEVCPVASYAHAWLPGDRSANEVTLGGAFGRTIVATPTLDVVPFADLRVLHTESSLGGSTASDNFGALELGRRIRIL